MTKSSLRHKLEQGYTNLTYQGSAMRNATLVVATTGLTIVHTAALHTAIGTLSATQGKTGETFTFSIVDVSGLFEVSGTTLRNIAANPPAGSYPVTLKATGNLGSTGSLPATITST